MEKKFVNGMMFKDPHQNAPDFVKGKISVKVDEFIAFANQHQNNGWLNIDLKQSKAGKMYFELDEWKPQNNNAQKMQQGMNNVQNEQAPPVEEEIPVDNLF